jgi:hypothetical protein
MFTNAVSNKWTETLAKVEATIELIIFNLGEVSFGIPISKIDRVVNKTNLERLAVCLDTHNSEETSESLAKPSRSRSVSVRRREMRRCDSNQDFNLSADIEILDLHHRLFGVSIVNPTAMVIFRGDRLTGILIDTTPTLISVPLDRIRILPAEFRVNNPLGIASHIAIISISNRESTIFIVSN